MRCSAELGHRQDWRCNGGCHRWVVGDDGPNSELELCLGSAIKLLIDCWVVAIKLDVG